MGAGDWYLTVATVAVLAACVWCVVVVTVAGGAVIRRARGQPDPPRQGVTVEEWRERLARRRREDEP